MKLKTKWKKSRGSAKSVRFNKQELADSPLHVVIRSVSNRVSQKRREPEEKSARQSAYPTTNATTRRNAARQTESASD